MAIIRQPSTDAAGATYIRVLADQLGTNQVAELVIHCSNGQSYNATIEGGTTGNYRSTTQTFTGLVSGQSYGFWGTGRTSGGTAINIPTVYFSTVYVPPADPDPSISSMSIDGKGKISVSWSVGNAAYMRSGDSMLVYMSGPNNGSQYTQLPYLQTWERSWEKRTDGLGNTLVIGATYTVWVYVFDVDGNSFGANRSVVFTKTRPDNFNWTTAKTLNGMYNLTATEWSSLLDTINLFRDYVTPKLPQRTFDRTISSGAINSYIVPTAASFNAARNAINDMNPPISVPSQVGQGGIVTASVLNGLRNSLNSII